MKIIIAAFHDRDIANRAALYLQEQRGYRGEDITLLDRSSSPQAIDAHQKLRGMAIPEDKVDLYAEAARRGATVLVTSADDASASETAAELDRLGSLDLDAAGQRWRAAGWTGYDASAQPYTDEETLRERERLAREGLPVIEEEVRIGTREVPLESVRVRTIVTEHPVHEEVPLREERIEVHREAVNEPLPASTADSTFTEEEFQVTARGEEVVVGKEARVVERVHIDKEVDTRTETVEETERRRDVEVTRAKPDEATRRP